MDTTYFKTYQYLFNDDKGKKGNFRSGSRTLETGETETFEWDVDQYGIVQRLEIYFPNGATAMRTEKYTVDYYGKNRFHTLYQPAEYGVLKYERILGQKIDATPILTLYPLF